MNDRKIEKLLLELDRETNEKKRAILTAKYFAHMDHLDDQHRAAEGFED